MSGEAIVMMVVAMLVLWGGLGLAVVNLLRQGAVEDRAEGGVQGGRHARGTAPRDL